MLPESPPLVSIGMPVYNRLSGLKSTLANIRHQSYRNLEIVVSDNCSPDPAIREYMTAMAEEDSRVRYVRQSVNIGLVRNFQYVQAAATADYFMWAADDDEHAPDFIERCMGALLSNANTASAMVPSEVHFRAKDRRVPVAMPALEAAESAAVNLRRYFAVPEPSIMYGVHRAAAIRWFLNCDSFPWVDCYFVSRLMLEGWNVAVLPGKASFASGVDAADYEAKPLTGKGFVYMPYFKNMTRSIRDSRHLTPVQKLEFTLRSLQFILAIFVKFQPRTNPSLCRVHSAFTLRTLGLALRLFPKVSMT